MKSVIYLYLFLIFIGFIMLNGCKRSSLSLEEMSTSIYGNNKYLIWNNTDKFEQSYKDRFKYLLFPIDDNVLIYDSPDGKEIKLLTRALLIQDDEINNGSKYYTVIVDEKTNGYVLKSKCTFQYGKSQLKHINNLNLFFINNLNYLDWKAVSIKIVKENQTEKPLCVLSLLLKRQIYVYEYKVDENELGDNAYPIRCWWKKLWGEDGVRLPQLTNDKAE